MATRNPPARTVNIVRCADYADALTPAFARILAESALLEPSAVAGRRVLVKPNLLTDRTPDEAVTTHPAFLRLVIRHLKAVGAHVTVGDSPACAANIRAVLERTGVGAVCEEEGVPFVSFVSHAGPLPLRVVLPRPAEGLPQIGETWRCPGWISHKPPHENRFARRTKHLTAKTASSYDDQVCHSVGS